MPFWQDKYQVSLLPLIIIFRPGAYLLGMPLLGIIVGISLWLHPTKNNRVQAPQPKQLKTASENTRWGYQILETGMPKIMHSNPQQYRANCKQALPYFKKAISLDPESGLAYQGQGISLICQNSKISGRNSLRKARTLYLSQGQKQDVQKIDFYLKGNK